MYDRHLDKFLCRILVLILSSSICMCLTAVDCKKEYNTSTKLGCVTTGFYISSKIKKATKGLNIGCPPSLQHQLVQSEFSPAFSQVSQMAATFSAAATTLHPLYCTGVNDRTSRRENKLQRFVNEESLFSYIQTSIKEVRRGEENARQKL